MAGGEDAAAAAELKGLARTFNSVTVRGRANVALATYAAVGVIGIVFWLKPKKKPADAAAKK